MAEPDRAARRVAKRRQLILLARTEVMAKYRLQEGEADGGVAPPDPTDASISKRKWEKLMGEWRAATREQCEAAAAAAAPRQTSGSALPEPQPMPAATPEGRDDVRFPPEPQPRPAASSEEHDVD